MSRFLFKALFFPCIISISHKEQVRKLRGDINIKAEELERLKGELTAEKYQK